MLRELELDTSLWLALQHQRSRDNPVALGDVANTQADEIIPAQLAVDGKIAKRQFPRLPRQLQADADCPNLFQSERELLSNQPAPIPREMLRCDGRCLIQDGLLCRLMGASLP